MADILKPGNEKDVEEAVRWALAKGKTLEIVGRGTKREYGRPSQSDMTLDMSGLSGVTLYEPAELVLSAKAGTPIAEIEVLVAEKGQQLAFEPMDYGPLLDGPANAGTLGGVIAANLAGSRRIKAGAARDHFLGVSAVSGRGEIFKSRRLRAAIIWQVIRHGGFVSLEHAQDKPEAVDGEQLLGRVVAAFVQAVGDEHRDEVGLHLLDQIVILLQRGVERAAVLRPVDPEVMSDLVPHGLVGTPAHRVVGAERRRDDSLPGRTKVVVDRLAQHDVAALNRISGCSQRA